jgi:hypothetical protein
MRKLCEIHIGVCATPNTWCLVSVRVLDRGGRSRCVYVAARFPPAFFVNFGDQPRIAVHGVSIGEHLALGGCMGLSNVKPVEAVLGILMQEGG